ncbi:hypothetical protein [Terriglobus tenax]|uniref:hypothetical protein n=1 Tax=Terriglobus tenax TaxID=1111115 RepID=UPI0021DFDD38|nr:hypothetical protein [Terriglobus tenax]
MKLRLFAALLGLLLTSAAAHAQYGFYINPVANRISNAQADTGEFAFMGEGNTNAWFKGVSYGGYATVSNSGKNEVGLDIRGSYVRNNNAPLKSFLIGLRGSHYIDGLGVRGYAEVLGGIGTSSAPHNPKSARRGQFMVLAGIDQPLNKHVDWRIVEVGYGKVSVINSTVVAPTESYASSTVFSVSTGLVFRFGGNKGLINNK